jgi:RHS repeat-associated protein
LTDAAGNLTDGYDYEWFGGVIRSSGTTGNVYLYAGEQFEQAVTNYYLRARYYGTETGRFMNPDPAEGGPFQPITLHRYLYANINPINNIDPTGRFAIGFIPALDNIVTIGLILQQHTPNFVRAGILLTGMNFFYKPGFALRQKGLKLLFESNGKLSEADRLYALGNKLIEIGSKGMNKADEIAEVVQTGIGLIKLAKSFKIFTQVTYDIKVHHMVAQYEIIAVKIEDDAILLFKEAATVSATQLSTMISRSRVLTFDILEAENLAIDILHRLIELKYPLE